MSHKIGVVDVGGGFRGIYAAGVFDYCLDNNITFDLCIGVSAGSANIASYMANQPRRNYQFINRFELVDMDNGAENDIHYNRKNDVNYSGGKNIANKIDSSPEQVIIFNYKEDEDIEDEKEELTCDLMGFLDAKTYTEKMNILKEMRINGNLDEHILRNCALSIDCIVDENGIDEQYHSIMNCLNMLSKYECTRFR